MQHNFQSFIVEANFSKTMKILRGDVPHVNTVAIITAHNPMAQRLSQNKNKELNRKLKAELKEFNYNPIHVSGGLKGKFEVPALEDTFLIPHIDIKSAKGFAKKYGQMAFIFGRKKTHKERGDYIKFEWWERKNIDGEFSKTQERNVVVSGEDAQSKTDLFSGVKMHSYEKSKKERAKDIAAGKRVEPAHHIHKDVGAKWGETPDTKKLSVPFFDPKYDNAMYSVGKRKIDFPFPVSPSSLKDNPLASSSDQSDEDFYDDDDKMEFYIPFFDDVMAGITPICEFEKEVNFVESELPKTEAVKEIVKSIRESENYVYSDLEKYTEKGRWIGRCGINTQLEKLKAII